MVKRYDRILVCVDRPEHASAMLDYVKAIARVAVSHEVHLLHVVDEAARAGAAAPPADADAEVTAEALKAAAGDRFTESGRDISSCDVLRGSPLVEALRFAMEREIDLIVVGRHYGWDSDADEDAVLARRITQKSSCSVLVLPDVFQIKADTVLVPVRDSECSANALEMACEIAAATDARVCALNVFRVHTGYSRVGTTLEEHQHLLESAAEGECDRLIKRTQTHGREVEAMCAADFQGRPVPMILETAASVGADLLVIGARGRSGAAGVLLGKVTERLISESPLPVLAVKKKGECLGVLKALLTVAGEG